MAGVWGTAGAGDEAVGAFVVGRGVSSGGGTTTPGAAGDAASTDGATGAAGDAASTDGATGGVATGGGVTATGTVSVCVVG